MARRDFVKRMMNPKVSVSMILEALESITKFADMETLEQIRNQLYIALRDVDECSLLDYETQVIADKRRDILEDYVRIYARRDHERACR